jgi:hypothetical protein
MTASVREAARQAWVERLVLVFAAAFGAFILLVHIVLPLLHIADFVTVDMRVPVTLEHVPGGAAELAHGEGVRVVRDSHAELVLDGADFGRRVAYRLPEMTGAAVVLVIVWLLRKIVYLARSGPFDRKAVMLRLAWVGFLLMALGSGVPVLEDQCMRVLADDAGVTAYAVPTSPLPYVLAALAVFCVVLAAGRDRMARVLGNRSAAEGPETAPRLSVSEPELASEHGERSGDGRT